MTKIQTKRVANIATITLLLAGVAWLASLFVHPRGAYTNNAQVRQDIVHVSARVQGYVQRICVDEFQHVQRGDTLLLIDDRELRLRVAQAEADYRNACAGMSAMDVGMAATHNNLSVSDAGIEEASVLLRNAEKDFLRYQKLLGEGAVTQQQFDAAKTQHDALRAKYDMLVRQRQSTALAKDEQAQRLGVATWHAAALQAGLELAKLQLSYATVTSPCDGYTSKKAVQEGELLMPGRLLMAVESDLQKWVVANYRETQRKYLHIGDRVDVFVDALAGITLEGRVAAISNATGTPYSPAAPDNTAGNFVKVEQRIPVKIEFTERNDRGLLLQIGAGMNAECNIRR